MSSPFGNGLVRILGSSGDGLKLDDFLLGFCIEFRATSIFGDARKWKEFWN